MCNQRIEDDVPKDLVSEQDRDRNVLNLMFVDSPWPWSVDEIARELQNRPDAEDAVCRLGGAVHRLGKFVFPTRAARRADELDAGSA